MKEAQDKLRKTARDLFEADKVDMFIGHEQGTIRSSSRPCVVRNADETANLVWNRYCHNNLAVYLPRFIKSKPPIRGQEVKLPRVGIAAKSCEIRSILHLTREKQINRDHLLIISMPCQGMLEPADRSGDSFHEERLVEACAECASPVTDNADIIIEGESREPFAGQMDRVMSFEKKSVEDRWQYFEKELSKCIRCYACREACPTCFCPVCFADQMKPRWTSPGINISDLALYHIIRIFHQAGRCVNCDACVNACPMDIDLRTFTQKMTEDVEKMFGFTASSLLAGETPPLSTFDPDETNDFAETKSSQSESQSNSDASE